MSMATKQGDIVIFRALFVFTRPITHAQFANCRACALKNRKPKKWHPVFDYPRARGISIPLTVNARGLWGRDCPEVPFRPNLVPRARAYLRSAGSKCHGLWDNPGGSDELAARLVRGVWPS